GKALGGASGGYVAAYGEIAAWLRQRARTDLFSNTLAPSMAAASLAALDLAEGGRDLRTRLAANSAYFRAGLEKAGFRLIPGQHPSIPAIIGDAPTAKRMSDLLLDVGLYAMPCSEPVVPERQAHVGPAPGRRRVCRGLLLSSGTRGQGPHPRPDVRGP